MSKVEIFLALTILSLGAKSNNLVVCLTTEAARKSYQSMLLQPALKKRVFRVVSVSNGYLGFEN